MILFFDNAYTGCKKKFASSDFKKFRNMIYVESLIIRDRPVRLMFPLHLSYVGTVVIICLPPPLSSYVPLRRRQECSCVLFGDRGNIVLVQH